MRFTIDIDYPPEKMDATRRRMEARGRFEYVDRVPVAYCVVPRFFAPLFGLRYIDFFADVETQFHWQLQFAKYRIERIPEDYCAGPVITVHPYFDNVVPPSGHGGEIGWTDDDPPRALPIIHTVEQMERFEVAAPGTGLRGKATEWWHAMRGLAAETRVTFGNLEGRVDVAPLSLAGLSPHMIAIDLVGQDFYWWMLEYPDACHRFLEKITLGEIASEDETRRIAPRPAGAHGIAEDSAQAMSADLFRRFCVPYANRLFERYGPAGRHVHMCGDSRHLLTALRDDVRMTSFDVFGYLVPPRVAADVLGGRSLLWGNIDPMLMQTGARDDVRAAAWECIDAMGPTGGLMLGDGANVCPGTPLASFEAVMEAAEGYGVPARAAPPAVE